jgi:hypothetical protein
MNMASSLQGSVQLALNIYYSGNPKKGVHSGNMQQNYIRNFQTGSTATLGDAQVLYADQITLAPSTNSDFDLSGTALKDLLGSNVAFTKVKFLLVVAADSNGGNIGLKGGAANSANLGFQAAAHQWKVPPGGTFHVSNPGAGWTIVATTGDLFNFSNDDAVNPGIFDLVLIGY